LLINQEQKMSKTYHNQTDKLEQRRNASVKRLKKEAHEVRAERRAGRWLRTGVSEATVAWMRERDML
jgi:hypothetical protein